MIKEETKIAIESGYYQLINGDWLFDSKEVPVPKNYNYVFVEKPTRILTENGKITGSTILSQEELLNLNIEVKKYCNHDYIIYYGLKEVFEYCKKCNEKKN